MGNERLKNMSAQELLSKLPKETSKTKLQKQRKSIWEMIKFIFRLDEKSSTSYTSSGYENNSVPKSTGPSPAEFRTNQRVFDPEQEEIIRMQANAYRRMVDGRGDRPEHHGHGGHGEK